jgi:hypothetical protein
MISKRDVPIDLAGQTLRGDASDTDLTGNSVNHKALYITYFYLATNLIKNNGSLILLI